MFHALALVRAVNLGQRGQPSAEQVLEAFRRAGADQAVSVRSNGTIVFAAETLDTPDAARELAERAMAELAQLMVRDLEVFTMPLPMLLPIVAEHGAAVDAERRELTLFDAERFAPDPLALAAAEHRAQCTVLEHGVGWLVALNHRPGQSNGTPLAEHLLGVSATSRALSTLSMAVERVL